MRALTLSCFSAVMGLSITLGASAAFAGFQWSPPSEHAPPPPSHSSGEKPVMLQDDSTLNELPTVDAGQSTQSQNTPSPVIHRQNVQPTPTTSRQPAASAAASSGLRIPPVTSGPLPKPGAPISLLEHPPEEPSAPSASPQHNGNAPYVASQPIQSEPLAPPPTPGETSSMQQPAQLKVKTVGGSGQQGDAESPTATPYTRREPVKRMSPATKPLAKPAITLIAKLPGENGDYSPVSGFGTDMPLALALQQVVPPSYGYIPEGKVDLGARVSWSGDGRPWDAVLNEMLAPLGLTSEIRGKNVHLRKQDAPIEMVEQYVDTTRAASAQKQPSATSFDAPAKSSGSMEKPSERPAYSRAENPALSMTSDMSRTVPSNAPVTTGSKLWQATQGESLRTILTTWSQRAGFSLVWQSPQDFSITSDILVTGSFENALDILMHYGLGSAAPSYELKPGILVVKD